VGFPEGVDFRQTESLGLQIVVTLVSQVDGRIEIKPGPGTDFRFQFQEVRYSQRT
jgi:two-component sensor histidine kinase